MLAGASGSTGETGASGQTGLKGGLRLWLSMQMNAGVAIHQFFHRQDKEYDTIPPIVPACRGQRLHRGDRGLWADGSHRYN